MSELETRMIASMDKAHFQSTEIRARIAMKVAMVADNENVVEILESYVEKSEGENTVSRLFSDEASAREWVGA